MGWLSDKEKEGEWIEGRESKSHRHEDGSWGRDIYAARVTYRGGEKVREKADYKNWGKEHIREGPGSK